MVERETNAQFAQTNEAFTDACEIVTRDNRFKEFKPSRRQASKWRRKMGLAWKVVHNIEIV